MLYICDAIQLYICMYACRYIASTPILAFNLKQHTYNIEIMIQCLFAINNKDSTHRTIPGIEIRLISFAFNAATL